MPANFYWPVFFFIKPRIVFLVLLLFNHSIKQKMSTMKTITTYLIIPMLILAQAASAQQRPVPDTTVKKYGADRKGERLKQMAEANREMMKQLNLTEEQQRQVRDLRQGEMATLKKLRADSGLTPEARRARMKTIRDEHAEKMKQILMPEQNNKLQELRKQRKGAMKDQAKQSAEARREMMKQLNLSEEQQRQLRELRQGGMTAIKKLRADSTLSPETRRDRLKTMHGEHVEKMKQVLTPEQYNKMQEFRKQRKAGSKMG